MLTITYMCYVFPAHAGMILWIVSTRGTSKCFPRSRGDDPGSSMTYQNVNEFSPLTRG